MRVLFVCLVLAAAGPAVADETWTLERIATKAESEAPVLSEVALGMDEARARVQAETRWPNPGLEMEFEEFGLSRPWASDVETTIAVTQAVPLSRRLRKARRLGEAAVDTARRVVDEHRVVIRAEARRRFYRALAAMKRLVLKERGVKLAERSLELIQARVEAGDLAGAALASARAGLARAKMDRTRTRMMAEGLRDRIAGLWGGAPGEIGSLSGRLEPEEPGPLSDALAAAERSVVLTRIRAEAEQASASESLERASAVPDLELGLGHRGIGGMEEHALVLTVSMSLPAWDRNRGRIAEARVQRTRILLQMKTWRTEQRSRIVQAHGRQRQHWSRYQGLVMEVIPELEKALEAASLGIARGKLDGFRLLSAQRDLLEAREAAIDAAEACRLAQVEVQLLIGAEENK